MFKIIFILIASLCLWGCTVVPGPQPRDPTPQLLLIQSTTSSEVKDILDNTNIIDKAVSTTNTYVNDAHINLQALIGKWQGPIPTELVQANKDIELIPPELLKITEANNNITASAVRIEEQMTNLSTEIQMVKENVSALKTAITAYNQQKDKADSVITQYFGWFVAGGIALVLIGIGLCIALKSLWYSIISAIGIGTIITTAALSWIFANWILCSIIGLGIIGLILLSIFLKNKYKSFADFLTQIKTQIDTIHTSIQPTITQAEQQITTNITQEASKIIK